MYIKEIEWIDKDGKEAILKVEKDSRSLMCFSCPCSYNSGDVLIEPLECFDTNDVILCETKENGIEKQKGEFQYKLKGKLKDKQRGIVEVYDFEIHIDEKKIPGDIENDMYIQFTVSRLDVW